MKKGILLVGLLFFIGMLNAQNLPKNCYGNYGGEMPAYSVFLDGASIDIEKHDVFVSISKTEVVYKTSFLLLSGSYEVFKQSKNEYVIKANLSNGKSVNYQIDLSWNKKNKALKILAKNGQSEALLEKLD